LDSKKSKSYCQTLNTPPMLCYLFFDEICHPGFLGKIILRDSKITKWFPFYLFASGAMVGPNRTDMESLPMETPTKNEKSLEPVGIHSKTGIRRTRPFDPVAVEKAIQAFLDACGFARDEEHLGNTPKRVRALWEERLLSGYDQDLETILGDGFVDPRKDLVVIRGIAIHGVCPHHLVPFRGVAHIGYLPGGRLHGFGRLARMIDAISHRLTYQEWLTRDVADALVTHGKARGAACIVDAEQFCLLLGENRRGEERVRTQAFSGAMSESFELRSEFLAAIA
jgi:GTP cyclohydrolase IA